MKSLRSLIRSWLGISEIESRLSTLDVVMKDISGHLSHVASLATYVKEKEDQAAEIFNTIKELPVASISSEEAEARIADARRAKSVLMDSPAIGSTEIRQKNNRLFELDKFVEELKKKAHAG